MDKLNISSPGGDGIDSCFASRLSRYCSLTPAETDFISEVENDARDVSAGQSVIRAGSPSRKLYVLKTGWAAVRSTAHGGGRQTLRIYLPGELIGLPEMGAIRAPHDCDMITEGVVCPFPKSRMTQVYTELPRLAALLNAISSLDQIGLRDRLGVLGLYTGREKVAYFLLDLHDRLSIANPNIGRRFRLPLRQADIAEVLGMTKVYVNRLLRDFVNEGVIEIDRPYVRILQADALRDLARYENRYFDLDSSWFPNAPEGYNPAKVPEAQRPS